jgi:hypothetical protein
MLGAKRPGSGIPMIAAIKSGVVMWKDVVPGVNPLTAAAGRVYYATGQRPTRCRSRTARPSSRVAHELKFL